MGSTSENPSYMDDGMSFDGRTYHTSKHNPDHLHPTDSDASGYTGSYIDDGADLIHSPRDGPGFGRLNPRFYGQERKAKHHEHGPQWDGPVQKAVNGDIQRSLKRMGNMRQVEADKGAEDEDQEDITVAVPRPRKRDMCVIEGPDRVIMIGDQGEFDSAQPEDDAKSVKRGAQAASTSTPAARARQIMDQVKPSVKWAQTPSPPKKPRPQPSRQGNAHHEHEHSPAVKRFPGRPESYSAPTDSPYDSDSAGSSYDSDSSTRYYMTGGATGWPTSDTDGFHVDAPSESTNYTVTPGSKSPIGSLPGSWPKSNYDDKISSSGTDTSTDESYYDAPSTPSALTIGVLPKTVEDTASLDNSPARWAEGTAGSTTESTTSDGTWDGYERVKTTSEFGNADSESVRSDDRSDETRKPTRLSTPYHGRSGNCTRYNVEESETTNSWEDYSVSTTPEPSRRDRISTPYHGRPGNISRYNVEGSETTDSWGDDSASVGPVPSTRDRVSTPYHGRPGNCTSYVSRSNETNGEPWQNPSPSAAADAAQAASMYMDMEAAENEQRQREELGQRQREEHAQRQREANERRQHEQWQLEQWQNDQAQVKPMNEVRSPRVARYGDQDYVEMSSPPRYRPASSRRRPRFVRHRDGQDYIEMPSPPRPRQMRR